MITRKIALAAFIACGFLLTPMVFADTAPCCAITSCEPCGYTPGANASNLPSPDACSVNPLINYAATVETCPRPGYFSGFYVGAAYGGGSVDYQLRVGDITPFDRLGRHRRTRGYLTTIVDAGFNFVSNCFFLGIEGGYDIRSRNNLFTFNDIQDFTQASAFTERFLTVTVVNFPCRIHLDVNSNHAVTADLLPGFVYSWFVVYLRLGIESNRFDINERVCFPFSTLSFPVAPAVTFPTNVVQSQEFSTDFKISSTGFRLGAGVGFAITPRISLHFNYIHTFAGRMSRNVDVTPITAIPPVIIGGTPIAPTPVISLQQLAAPVTIEPRRDEFNFGVKFRF